MIDVSPYIDKLEALKEYVAGLIDGRWSNMAVTINFEAIPTYPIEEIMRIFQQTGMLFYNRYETKITEEKRSLTFDEWYNSKNTKQ